MSYVVSEININTSADLVWQVVSDFGRGGDVISGVIDCVVEETGVGTLRTLTFADGSTLVERLVTLDEVGQQLTYFLLTDTPFGNCLTRMAVADLGPNRAELVWSATFEAEGLPESEAEALLTDSLIHNCLTLKRCIEG